jgi:hypothetical protein
MGVATEASLVANAIRPAVQLDLLRVDFQDFVQRQEEWVHRRRLFSEFLECFAVSMSRTSDAARIARPARSMSGRPSVLRSSGDFRIDFQQVENRPVNHQRQAVSVLREPLDHSSSCIHCANLR